MTEQNKRKKNIAIDASRAFVHERTGIEEYAYQVIKHLRAPLGGKSVVLYVRFRGEAAHDPRGWIQKHFFDLPEAWDVRVVGLRRLWTQCGLAFAMLRDRPQALFVPAHTVPWIHPRNTIVVIHGLEYEMTPEAYSLWARFYMRLTIKMSCKWSRSIIAVSKNTQRDIMRLYGVAHNKIRVVYEGVNAMPSLQQEAITKKSDVPYFFFIGRREQRKNIIGLIKAFELFKEKTNLPHQLIIAGGTGYGYKEIARTLERSAFRGSIHEIGFVSEEQKWHYLRGAQAFVFPTLYEGFGLPVLEAQQAGVPVITSDSSSLPEVIGEGISQSAISVDPKNVQELAGAMERIATNKSHRHDIINKGYENQKRFSWDKCAQKIAEIIHKRAS